MSKHQSFIDYFVHEFMEELWYLQKVTRGDIPKRVEADPMETFFNVTQGLLSLAPIPGLPLGFLLSKELVKKCVEYGEKALQLARAAQAAAQSGYQKTQEFLSKVDSAQKGYETLMGKAESKGMLQQDGPMDLTAIRILVELLARGLAERYEHVLSDYLGAPPEKSQIPLARVMAKRLFAYLQSQPLLANPLGADLLAQRTRVMNGVVLGNVDKSWRERLTSSASGIMPRVLKDMQQVELPLQPTPKQSLGRFEKFTAIGVIKRSAWYDAKQVYAHSKTDWQTLKGKPQQPKYGYAFLADFADLKQKPLDLKAVDNCSAPPRATRYYREVGIRELQAYLSCPAMQTARATKKTCPYSFHDFLREQGHPKDLQAVCHDDLSIIKDWSFATVSGVDFSGSTLTGNVSGTDFSGSYLVGITAKGLYCSKEYPALFKHTQLGFSDLEKAILPKADFTQADLSLTNFSQADLTDIQSLGAIWYKTDLTGITRHDLLAEQAQQVADTQKQFRARMREMDGRITQLEQTLAPMLAKLDVLESSQGVAAGKTESLEQQIVEFQAQISSKANVAFQTSCEAELRDLRARTEALRQDVDQLSGQMKVQIQDVTQLKTELTELKAQYAGQITLSITGAGDVGRKILVEQTMVQLTHRVKDLEFYLPPTVIKELPEKMTLDELMAKLNAITPQDAKTSHPEAKREHKGEAVGGDAALTQDSAPLPQRFDAITVIDQFLTQEENLLLLLGEPGAGKTLSTWQATRRLIAKFTPGMSGQQISQCWLPIHIELNQFDLNELSHLLDRQLQSFGLNAAAITKLKQATPGQTEEPRILLILDGYDELRITAGSSRREHTDLFQRIGGAGWKAGQLKVLVTCRRRYLSSDSEERMIFGVGQYQRYQRFELLPFTLTQVAQYVTTRSAKDVGGGLLKAERYLHAIQQSDNIRTLVSNPFVLQLFLESLPRLNQGSENLSHLARYDLYTAFFDQWIEREVRRLGAAKKAALGRESDVALVADFKRLARYLALSMYAKGTINVEFIKPQQITKEYEVWFSVLKQVAIEAEQEYQTLEEANSAAEDDLFGLASNKPKLEKAAFMRQTQARANQLIDLLPLSRSGNSYRFVHKSFYEYLVAASIIDLAQADVAFETAALACLKQQLIQSEPAVLDFITELSLRLRQEPHRLYPALRTKLFALIARSAQEPSLHYASSNAATILNACHETFMQQSWQNVQLACADFSYANLAHSDLRGANLRSATFIHTILYQTQLDGADCRDLIWGEQPRVQLTEIVRAIAHHPSQPWLAVAQGDNILLVNSQTGEQIGAPLIGHTKKVNSVAFSPDGRLLVSGSEDRTLRLWDVGKQEALGAPFTGHTSWVSSVAFSPDGGLLVSGSFDHTLRLWDVGKQEAVGAPLTGHTNWVRSVAFSPDGRLLVSGSNDKTLRLWDVAKQEAVGLPLTGHTSPVASVAFSQDGRLVVSGSLYPDCTLRLWDVGKQEAIAAPLTGHTRSVTSVAFSPDGRLVVSVSEDKTLRLWDVGKQVAVGAPLTGHSESVTSVAFSPDGRLLVSGSDDKTLRLWDVGKQKVLGAPFTGHARSVWSVAFSLNGRLVVSGSDDKTLRLWDVGKQVAIGTPFTGHTMQVSSVAFSPDGRPVVSGSWDNTLRLWDVGKHEALGASLTGHTEPVTSITFSPDGRLVVSGSWDKTLRLWDIGKQVAVGAPLTGHTDYVNSVAFSPDGRLVVSGSWDKTLRLWDVGKQEVVGAPLTGHTDKVWSVAFSPDGRRVVSGSIDKTLRLWDVAQQEVLGTPLTGHTEAVMSVAFSPDGRLVVSGSRDKTLCLWDIASARCVATLPWHQSIYSVAMIAPQLPVALPHSSIQSESKNAKMTVAEDWLVFGDAAGTISFWAVSRAKEPMIRFLGMPRHNAMPLLVDGISLRGCQMNAVSKRLLQQYGADVSHVTVVTESAPISASASSSHSVPDLKHRALGSSLPAPKHQTPDRPVVTTPTDHLALPTPTDHPVVTTPTDSKKAPPASPPHQASASSPYQAAPSIAPTSALFSPSASASQPKSPADVKAQQLLQELYALVDEIYPQNNPASTPQRQTLLAQLQPYQDRQVTLSVADRSKLRAIQGTLEEAQAALSNQNLII